MLILAGANYHQLRVTPTGRVFALFLYLNVVAMVCIGFRWSHELKALLPVAATLAVISIALLYLAFRSLGRRGPVVSLSRDWPHLIPLMLLLVVVVTERYWTDAVLIVTKLVYAGLLVLLAHREPDALQLVRLHWLNNTQQALWGAVTLLLLSAGLDLAITIDFAVYEGRHAAGMVGMTNLATACLLGWASVMAGRGMSSNVQVANSAMSNGADNNQLDSDAAPVPVVNTSNAIDDGDHLMQQLNQLLIDQRLFADTDLNLQKLARKVGVPARTVSRAINIQAGKNVSQWVNAARVDAACELLLEKQISVTTAMHEVGFVTKSNFNREFRRLKGCSPSQWRTKH